MLYVLRDIIILRNRFEGLVGPVLKQFTAVALLYCYDVVM